MDKPKNLYEVQVYNGKSLLTIITVEAKDVEDASFKAREIFFRDINAKVKRAYA
jgi:hypothetical protein